MAKADQQNGEQQELDLFCKQWAKDTRRVAIFVEPSPFAYVCGYKTRFLNYIQQLREMGDEVLVVTTHKGAPKEYHGAKVLPSWSFPCPFYPVPLSWALSPRIVRQVADFKPDVIHSTSPGLMVFGALATARALNKPLLYSYHTHVPAYIPKYTFPWLVGPMWAVTRFLHQAADHCITTSHALARELIQHKAAAGKGTRMGVWPKAVDSQRFNPRWRSDEMRKRLSGGETNKPLILHVGRLGAEKNLHLLRDVLNRCPGARLAFVGDGPSRAELEQLFAGTGTVFAGMLQGAELSAAYASADLFVTPSESETLGNVVLEAMASGVPVVAARAGGIPDIIDREGVNGFLFEPGSVEDAVAKIKPLIASKKLRSRTAETARKEAEGLTWKAASRNVRDVGYGTTVFFAQKKQEKKR